MKKKVKWNYAVIRSIFGNYWIGKTQLKADEIRIFSDIEDVIKQVEEQFLYENMDFDPDLCEDDENYDDEMFCQFSDIRLHAEEPEEIIKTLEKFIIKL
jgi:hypothetical protein